MTAPPGWPIVHSHHAHDPLDPELDSPNAVAVLAPGGPLLLPAHRLREPHIVEIPTGYRIEILAGQARCALADSECSDYASANARLADALQAIETERALRARFEHERARTLHEYLSRTLPFERAAQRRLLATLTGAGAATLGLTLLGAAHPALVCALTLIAACLGALDGAHLARVHIARNHHLLAIRAAFAERWRNRHTPHRERAIARHAQHR